MNENQQKLIDRFAGFIQKLEGRLREIMDEAAQGVAALREQNPTDFLPITNAFSGLDARIRVLEDKLEATWDEQIEEKFEDAGILDHGLTQRTDARMRMEEAWNEWKAEQAADFYRALEPRAREEMAQPVNCSQCAGALERTAPLEAESINCPACGALNQVMPGPAATAFAGAPHAFAVEKAIPIRFEIEKFRQQCDDWRRVREWAAEPLQHFEKWEQMERNYWNTYAQTLAETSGKPFDQALVDARMKQFIHYSLESEQVWVKAKGRIAWP